MSNYYNEDIFPTESDVLFGKGKGADNHPGNKHFRTLISRLVDEYDTEDKIKKNNVAVKVRNEIQSFGRFLSRQGEIYYIETDRKVMDKIKQAFRDRLKKILKDRCESSTSQGAKGSSITNLMDTASESFRNVFNHLTRSTSGHEDLLAQANQRSCSQDSFELPSMVLILRDIFTPEHSMKRIDSSPSPVIEKTDLPLAPKRWLEMEKKILGINTTNSGSTSDITQIDSSDHLEQIYSNDSKLISDEQVNESRKRQRFW